MIDIKTIANKVSNFGNTINTEGGNINGVLVAGDNFGEIKSTAIMHSNDKDSELFLSDAKKAIVEIRKISELTEEQKSSLIEIINEAEEAVKKNSCDDKEKSKIRFKDAMRFLGNTGFKVISALSSLSNLTRFFGI